jgi:hypothetical protein
VLHVPSSCSDSTGDQFERAVFAWAQRYQPTFTSEQERTEDRFGRLDAEIMTKRCGWSGPLLIAFRPLFISG